MATTDPANVASDPTASDLSPFASGKPAEGDGAPPIDTADSNAHPAHQGAELEAADRDRRRMVAVAVTLGTSVLLLALALVARVPVGAGWRVGRNLPVREIWWLFTHELSAVAGNWLSPALVTGLVGLMLVGGAALVGLAVLVPDEQTAPDAE